MAEPRESGIWPLRLRRGATWAAWTVAAIAGTGFLGWLVGLPALASLGADFPPILPTGIVALVFVAVALFALLGSWPRYGLQAARAAALLVGTIAFLSLLERVEGVALGLDFDLAHLGYRATANLSVGTACALMLLAGALGLATGGGRRSRAAARRLAAGVAGIALVVLVGLIFRIVRFNLAVPSLGMALPMALALLASSFSLLTMHPETRLVRLLEQDSPGAIIFRRLLPVALALPVLAGWVQALGQRSGWFDVVAGEGLVTVSTVLVCAALILWTSSKLDDMNVRRSLAETRADTQREWLEVTLAHIADAVIAANDEGRVGFMNPAAEELCGIESSLAVGRPVAELLEMVDERTRAPLACPLLEALERRQPVHTTGEPAVNRRGGQLKAVEVSAMPILGGGGTLLGGVLVLRDASEHRARENAMRNAYTELDRRVGERTRALERTSAALRESTALLRTIAASTPELILAKDRECRIMMINPAALQALGLTREEAVGHREIDIFGESSAARQRLDNDRRVLESGQPIAVEETLATPAGERIYLVTKSPLRDEDGVLLGLVSVATDITERKRAQRELEQLLLAEHRLRGEAERASRAKDEFLAIVSHELRSPLNALKGWSQILAGTANPDPDLSSRAAHAIKRNVEHQTRLIDDLLDTSRIIVGKLVLERRPVNLVEVVQAALDLAQAGAQAKGVELRLEAARPVLAVDGDPGRLQQVAINLISNGIKFTPRGGAVDIRLRPAGDRVLLEVSDNGIGIEPDFLPHVFDRFSQADSSTTRRYSGLGIGLALVRHLVEMHGGTVVAGSPGPGRGSTFLVDLPAVAGGIDSPLGERRLAGESLAGIQVLLVDDEADARDVMQLYLSRAGAQVQMFESGKALVARLREQPLPPTPAVLLLDIAMPGEDGFGVLAAVRALEHLPPIPAIAVTALTHLDHGRLLAAGFQGWLGKPVEPSRLLETIAGLVGRGERG